MNNSSVVELGDSVNVSVKVVDTVAEAMVVVARLR